ncbi:MAG: hypothetical protein EHM28_10115 [Spirochaetaceae bacterium]|nr:MAG: hypothetical protein EHM28_10115 [Spirochaetaceae bacterium]
MQSLTHKALEVLMKRISSCHPSAFGEYEYMGIRIIVKKPTLLLNRERSKRLYESRRARGICVHCGIKVRERNPKTGVFYRYCAIHRRQELDRKKQRRRQRSIRRR